MEGWQFNEDCWRFGVVKEIGVGFSGLRLRASFIAD